MSDGLNGSGVHKIPSLGIEAPRRKRSRLKAHALNIAKIAGVLGAALGAAYGSYVKATGENKGTSASVAAEVADKRSDARLLVHDTEIAGLHDEIRGVRNDIKKLSDALLLEEPPTPVVSRPPKRMREPQ